MATSVTTSNCTSGSSCAVGSTCTSTSQCATGSCCGYQFNLTASCSNSSAASTSNSTSNGSSTTFFSNQNSYNTYLACVFLPWRTCLPSSNGTYFNSTTQIGSFLNATNSSSNATYTCLLPITMMGQ